MFNVSLSERLKAAVNQLEATGTSLQARAQAGLGPQNPQLGEPSATARDGRPGSPSARTRPSATIINDPGAANNRGEKGVETSPTRSSPTTYNPATLAEGALSGLKGLRGSFHFSRPSLDGGRSGSGLAPSGASDGSRPGLQGAGHGRSESQELKEIPTSPIPRQGDVLGSAVRANGGIGDTATAGPSRPSSPARFLGSTFAVGSDPSSLAPTPQPPRSPPGPSGLGQPPDTLGGPATTQESVLPAPDPDDPATYPLPPSPTIEPASVLLSPGFGDPLGASPLISPVEQDEIRSISLDPPLDETGTASAVEIEKAEAAVPQGHAIADVDGGSAGAEKGIAARILEEAGVNVSTVVDVPNGDAPAATPGPNASASQSIEQSPDKVSILQAQILAADTVLRELTPLEGGIADAEALEGWVRMMKGKVDMITEEMQRLQGQIKPMNAEMAVQDSRMEELRDTHRLEGSSQSELIAQLRSKVSTAETDMASKAGDLAALPQLRTDLARAQTQAKEEEEKRTKAISLLKTVRMKLVKAEKDKEEVEKDRAEERAERSRANEEVERVKAEREREVTRLRQGFEREVQGVKDRAEKEMKERKASWELDMITTKAQHAKDITAKTSLVTGLEAVIKELNTTKDEQFHVIQARHAEAEAARGEAETLQNRTRELEYQLREANERVALLEDNARIPDRGRHTLGGDRFTSSPSPSPSRHNSSGTSASEVQRLLAEAEARAEAKLSDLRFRIRSLEKERTAQEEEFGQKLQERVFELEKVRRAVTEKDGEVLDALRKVDLETQKIAVEVRKREVVEKEFRGLEARLEESREDVATAQESEKMAKNELSQIKLQLQSLNGQVEEQKQLVQSLRNANKTLRDELRKVQSSVQLMERSRNPGVGYWSSANNHASASPAAPAPISGSGISSEAASVGRSGDGTPVKDSRASLESIRTETSSKAALVQSNGTGPSPAGKGNNDEEEVNLEYLRNVILQFLENPHMRRQLVQVLSVILHFTPQELRRLNAKVTAP